MNNPLDDFLSFCGKHCFLFLSLFLTTLAFMSTYFICPSYPSQQIYYLDLFIWVIATFSCLPLRAVIADILQHKLPADEKRKLKYKFILRILITDALPIVVLFVSHLLFVHCVPWLFILFALMDASRIVLQIPNTFNL